MASVLDQLEQSLYSGSQNEKPMFSKSKVNFEPDGVITHLAVSNQSLALIMDHKIMLRIDLRHPDNIQRFELNRLLPGVPLVGIFLDHTGDHLLLSYQTELLYHYKKSQKPKPATKARGHVITAVGWYSGPREKSDSSASKPILLGTSKGAIIEMELSGDESRIMSSPEIYSKQLFVIGKGSATAITGLQYHSLGDNQYFVIVTTVNWLYQFVGTITGGESRPLLQPLFQKYYNTEEDCMVIPNSLDYSILQINPPCTNSTTQSRSLAWLSSNGIFHAKIDGQNEANLFSNTDMINFPSDNSPPLSFVMTDFHIFLLTPTNVTVIFILNKEVVFVDPCTFMYGKLVSLAKDPITGVIWLYAERGVFRYNIHREDRNVWQVYMEKGEYEMAKKYCMGNPVIMDQVLLRQADDLFSQGRYEDSAKIYADTQSSFEEIAFKFLQNEEQRALKIFLMKKVARIRQGEEAQGTMLVLWVLETMLSSLAELRIEGNEATYKYEAARKELHEFFLFPHVKEVINKNKQAVYELLTQHGDKDNLAFLAVKTDDYEALIYDAIYEGDHLKALSIVRKQGKAALWYQFAPVLVQALPKETIAALIAEPTPLNPSRILPALIASDTYQIGELIRYLEYCVNDLNTQEQAIHNFLLSLYAAHQPDKLLSYLAMQGEDASMVNYDPGFGLRVCLQWNRREAAVDLASILGLWDKAVEQALDVSTDLARERAARANDRRLWLKIAEHIVKKKNDIAQAMKFIQQCDSIKIEDILPFFADFVSIDHFKDAICSSLEEYNQHIQDLNDEMEDATKSAESIRTEIQSFRSRYTIVNATDLCESCVEPVLAAPMRGFYVFPCGHKFHSACLARDIVPILSPSDATKLSRIQSQLSSAESKSVQKDKLKADLDSLLASQCLFCGDRMIEMIKKPLISDEDYERIQQEWK